MFRKLAFFLGLGIGYVLGTQASVRQRERVADVVDRVVRPGGAPSTIGSAEPLRPSA